MAAPAGSVREGLRAAAAAGVARLDAELLMAHLLGRPRTWVIAHDEAPLDPATLARWQVLVAARRDGQPVAYLTGRHEFRGLALTVTPAVLDPRPDTETLVDWAVELLGTLDSPAPEVVDLGTGSGAIALALKDAWPTAQLSAVERSPAALAVARTNGARLGLGVDWRAGDWWQAVAGERFDLAVSNPPYVRRDDPHLAALRHEPIEALVAGVEGLDDFRRIIAGAAAHLRPGAWLLLEHGHDQADAVQGLLRNAGLTPVTGRTDLSGQARCSGGRIPTTGPA
jgi:release factor glutamine methyltransferase